MKKLFAFLLALLLGCSCAMAEDIFTYDPAQPITVAAYQAAWADFWGDNLGTEPTWSTIEIEGEENALYCNELNVGWLMCEGDVVTQIVIPVESTADTIADDIQLMCGAVAAALGPVAALYGVDEDTAWSALQRNARAIASDTDNAVMSDNTITMSGLICGIPCTMVIDVSTDTEATFYFTIDFAAAK